MYNKPRKENNAGINEFFARLSKGNPDPFKDILISDSNRALRTQKRKALDLLQKVFNNTHILIALLDRDFNFIQVNQTYADHEGHKPDFYVGKNHFELFPNKENEAIFTHVRDSGKAFQIYAKAFEYRDAPERGMTYWDWSLIPIKEEDGSVSTLILSLLEVTERVQAEQMVFKNREKLRSLVQELTLAEERERWRIGQGLHDFVKQRLAAIKLQAGILKSSNLSQEQKSTVTEMFDSLTHVIDDIQDLSFEFTLSRQIKEGLENALRELGQMLLEKHAIGFEFSTMGEAKPILEDLAIVLFNCVRELLLNIVKHAKAKHVQILFFYDEENISIAIEDDGCGFEASSLNENQSGGFGLFSVRERLSYLGGEADIESSPGQGTRISLHAPYIRPSGATV